VSGLFFLRHNFKPNRSDLFARFSVECQLAIQNLVQVFSAVILDFFRFVGKVDGWLFGSIGGLFLNLAQLSLHLLDFKSRLLVGAELVIDQFLQF
jgi:hypothetical protein